MAEAISGRIGVLEFQMALDGPLTRRTAAVECWPAAHLEVTVSAHVVLLMSIAVCCRKTAEC